MRIKYKKDGMARPVRINVQDGIYHVMSRGDNRKVIFHDDWDGEHFEELLSELKERFRRKLGASLNIQQIA